MTPIALLIAANIASGAPDRRADAHLYDTQLDTLRRGFAPERLIIEPVRWAEAQIDWTRFGAVLVHCAWDYQDRHEQLLATLDSIAALGVPVFNSPASVRWNIRKTYLREMESRGIPIIPTLWPERPTAQDIREAFAVFGTDDVVLKRQVGGGARAQVRYKKGDEPARGEVMDRPGMIQPLIPSIVFEGEYSFLFIDGDFSHALVKRAKAGDYRIQEAYGGRSQAIDPSAADVVAARATLDALEEAPLYARVDMVRGADGRLLLMELEVIEPYLYPADGPGIGSMLGKALRRRLGESRTA
jgi:glutathione synthase/RimK-type ligase-like ATP-grasp enzyme